MKLVCGAEGRDSKLSACEIARIRPKSVWPTWGCLVSEVQVLLTWCINRFNGTQSRRWDSAAEQKVEQWCRQRTSGHTNADKELKLPGLYLNVLISINLHRWGQLHQKRWLRARQDWKWARWRLSLVATDKTDNKHIPEPKTYHSLSIRGVLDSC